MSAYYQAGPSSHGVIEERILVAGWVVTVVGEQSGGVTGFSRGSTQPHVGECDNLLNWVQHCMVRHVEGLTKVSCENVTHYQQQRSSTIRNRHVSRFIMPPAQRSLHRP